MVRFVICIFGVHKTAYLCYLRLRQVLSHFIDHLHVNCCGYSGYQAAAENSRSHSDVSVKVLVICLID